MTIWCLNIRHKQPSIWQMYALKSQQWILHLLLYAIIISIISSNSGKTYTATGYLYGGVAADSAPVTIAAITTIANQIVTSNSVKTVAATWSANFFNPDQIRCPSLIENPACPCYKFDDGNFVVAVVAFSSFILM